MSDLDLLTIIDLLLENNEAVKKLTVEGFNSQTGNIIRNTSEILTRVIAKSIFYERTNCNPSECQKIDISSDIKTQLLKSSTNIKIHY